MRKFIPVFLITFCLLLFYFKTGNNQLLTSPFDLSISASRYALTQSIVENHSVFFTPTLAQFSAPDVAFINNQFISLFTPGVSLIGVPFYVLGKLLGSAQFFTLLTMVLFAVINLYLVVTLTRKLGSGVYASVFSGVVFIFATNVLGYSLLFVQHPVSVTLLLLAVINVFEKRTFLSNCILGGLYGVGMIVDIPNVFFFLPVVIYILYQHVRSTHSIKQFVLNKKPYGFLLGVIPFIILFFIYNFISTGSFLRAGQTIGRTDYFRQNLLMQNPAEYVYDPTPPAVQFFNLPFEIRSPLYGLYVLLISQERAWIWYSPIVLVGVLGLIVSYTVYKKKIEVLVITSIILINILLYSMFNDPWGGWAFGPRYLIPSAALLCAAIGPFMYYFRKNIAVISIVCLLFFYSAYVSSLGAITTTAVPPKMEAQRYNLPYTYHFNQILIEKNMTSSFVYNNFLRNSIPLSSYLLFLTFVVGVLGLILIYKNGRV